jgi:hypothetical protein
MGHPPDQIEVGLDVDLPALPARDLMMDDAQCLHLPWY